MSVHPEKAQQSLRGCPSTEFSWSGEHDTHCSTLNLRDYSNFALNLIPLESLRTVTHRCHTRQTHCLCYDGIDIGDPATLCVSTCSLPDFDGSC